MWRVIGDLTVPLTLRLELHAKSRTLIKVRQRFDHCRQAASNLANELACKFGLIISVAITALCQLNIFVNTFLFLLLLFFKVLEVRPQIPDLKAESQIVWMEYQILWNISILFNVVHRKVHWLNSMLKSLNQCLEVV